VLFAIASLIGFVVLGITLSSLVGAGRTAQILATLVLPSSVMILYWRAVRGRILEHDAELAAAIDLEDVTRRATGQFLVGVSHDLRLHPERCNLRAEALAVAVDYRQVSPDLKVAVPDIVLVTDPHLLRHVLHVLVGNALRHGGRRVAIWAAPEEDDVRLTVSDDGPGLPKELAGHVFERYVDLGEQVRTTRPSGAGLALARAFSELMGGQMMYKRDPSWTHFSIRLPVGSDAAGRSSDRVPLEAGVR
jgi:hypothetical protein